MAMLQPAEDDLTPGASAYWTPLPNELLARLIWTRSSAAQSVVLYVLRHTYGYHETAPKAITLEEFQHGRKRRDGTRIDTGTGLSRSAVIDGLKRAVEAGLLREEIDAHDRARIVKRYAIASAVGSPLATSGEQPMHPEGALPAQQRLTLIKGRLQELPETTAEDEVEKCEESPLAPSTDEHRAEAQIVQGSPTTPSGIANECHSGSQRLPQQLPTKTSIRERNAQKETQERYSRKATFHASRGRPLGANRQEERAEDHIEGRPRPDASVVPGRARGDASPIAIEHEGDQMSSVETPPSSAGSMSDLSAEPTLPQRGMAEPVLQVEPEQLASWQADVAEQRRAVARAQADYERVSAELERYSPGGRAWCDLRREQRFVQHRLEAEQQKLAQFELFVQLIEQGYSKDQACKRVYTQAQCPTEPEVAPDGEAEATSQDESTMLDVSVKEPTPAPDLSPKAWRAALFTRLLELFGWEPGHLNKNSRGLANKAAMLLEESGIRPEQLPRLKQLFERAYPKVTHYTPIALANHATELAAFL